MRDVTDCTYFDFDGTLLPERNSVAWRFVQALPDRHWRRRKSQRFVRDMAALIASALAGAVDHDAMFRAMLRSVFQGLPVELAQRATARLAERVDGMLYPRMRAELQARQHTRLLLVTKNAEPFVRGFCQRYGMQCVATELETHDGRYTGRVLGALCGGGQKMARLRALGHERRRARAYGNSLDDLPMLRASAEAVLVNPDPQLDRAADLAWAPRIYAR